MVDTVNEVRGKKGEMGGRDEDAGGVGVGGGVGEWRESHGTANELLLEHRMCYQKLKGREWERE